jgi:DNA-binding NarL/FixJ family response regulator
VQAAADDQGVEAAQKDRLLTLYLEHARRADEIAARRRTEDKERAPLRLVSAQKPSARELEVLRFTAEGLANKEIAAELFLAEETVKAHMRNLLAKLHAKNRAHAVAISLREGWID